MGMLWLALGCVNIGAIVVFVLIAPRPDTDDDRDDDWWHAIK